MKRKRDTEEPIAFALRQHEPGTSVAEVVRKMGVKEREVSYEVSQGRACWALRVARSTVCFQSLADDRADLRIRLRDLASNRVRYGDRRLHLLLQREDDRVNPELECRLSVEEDLCIRRKSPRRRKSAQVQPARPVATRAKASWPMDFLPDQRSSGVTVHGLGNSCTEAPRSPSADSAIRACPPRATIRSCTHRMFLRADWWSQLSTAPTMGGRRWRRMISGKGYRACCEPPSEMPLSVPY